MKTDKKPDGRGGARPGAGRKRSGEDMVNVTLRLPRVTAERWRRLAEIAGVPRVKFLAKLINETPAEVFRD